MRVADSGPGEEIRLAKSGERLQGRVEAVSIGKLDRVEIVVNGEILRTFTAAEAHRVSGNFELAARRGLWVAARAYGPEDGHLASELEGRSLGAGQFAHTSPVYVRVEGETVMAAKPADAEYFVRWCDAVLEGWRRHVAAAPEQARHEALVTGRLAHARKVFAELANRRR